jgi:hypothetical protein
MMKQWLSAYDVEALYEKVHTVEAMHRFLDQEGHNIATRFIHIMAHGLDGEGAGTATLHLTFDELDLYNQADVFAGLEGKVIILSCCEVGSDSRVMRRLKKVSGAMAVIGYRLPVDDWYTNLVEVLLYDRLINSNMPPDKAVKLAIDALDKMGTQLEGSVAKKPVLVCF